MRAQAVYSGRRISRIEFSEDCHVKHVRTASDDAVFLSLAP